MSTRNAWNARRASTTTSGSIENCLESLRKYARLQINDNRIREGVPLQSKRETSLSPFWVRFEEKYSYDFHKKQLILFIYL